MRCYGDKCEGPSPECGKGQSYSTLFTQTISRIKYYSVGSALQEQFKFVGQGPGLVVQWLRICLWMSGTWVQIHGLGRFHMLGDNSAGVPQILWPAYSGACTLRHEKPQRWGAPTLQLESSPDSLHPEKAHATVKSLNNQKWINKEFLKTVGQATRIEPRQNSTAYLIRNDWWNRTYGMKKAHLSDGRAGYLWPHWHENFSHQWDVRPFFTALQASN